MYMICFNIRHLFQFWCLFLLYSKNIQPLGRNEQQWNEEWRKFRRRCQEISQISGQRMGGNHLHTPLSLFPFSTLDTLQNTDPYKPIDGLKLKFDDANGPNPFRIIENDHGELLLADDKTKHHYALCQYWKTVNQDVYELVSIVLVFLVNTPPLSLRPWPFLGHHCH